MVTQFDNIFVPLALELIAEFGISAVFAVPATKTFSATTNAVTEAGGANLTETVSPPLQYTERYIDGKLIQRGDARIYIASSGLSFVPLKGMKVTITGKIWRIVATKILQSGDLVSAYAIQLRGI